MSFRDMHKFIIYLEAQNQVTPIVKIISAKSQGCYRDLDSKFNILL